MHEQKRRKLWIGAILIGMLAVYVTLDSGLVTGEDVYARTGKGLETFGQAYKLLNRSYFKQLDPEELATAAIEGMLEELDPYTQFFDRRALEQLRIDTQGKFGGLGITISVRKQDGPPTVMSVIQATPADTAGLRVGDRIVKIEGEPTFGKSLQEVVDILRGTPGSEVMITIDRAGRPQPFDQRIIRARVGIKSVEVAEEVEGDIGYISMMSAGPLNSRFSEKTGPELEAALRDLKAQDVQGVILDLRGNPGGLLDQAVEVVDKFLDTGRLVVSTRGRDGSKNEEKLTEEPAVLRDTPLVVLVNSYSASASEIVAGAIQDSDRGLIVGTTTFGKGSVQTVRQIADSRALKLTTALYYTPSGRSIHKGATRRHSASGLVLTVADSIRIPVYQVLGVIGQASSREAAIAELIDQFDLQPAQAEEVVETPLSQLVGLTENHNEPKGSDPKEAFKTTGGRTVYGGGGITPDVVMKPQRPPRLAMALKRAGLFFDFAVSYAADRSFPERYDDFSLDETALEAFRVFLADSVKTGGFRYKTHVEAQLTELTQSLSETTLTEAQQTCLASLGEAADREGEAEFEKARPYIRLEIERELANRVWGSRAYLLASLKGDKQFQEAVRILKDSELYSKKMGLAVASK